MGAVKYFICRAGSASAHEETLWQLGTELEVVAAASLDGPAIVSVELSKLVLTAA